MKMYGSSKSGGKKGGKKPSKGAPKSTKGRGGKSPPGGKSPVRAIAPKGT